MLRNLSVCYGLDLIFGFCALQLVLLLLFSFPPLFYITVFNQTTTDLRMYNPWQTISLLQPFSSMYCLHVCILFLAYQGIISCLFLPLICPLPDSFAKLAYVFFLVFFAWSLLFILKMFFLCFLVCCAVCLDSNFLIIRLASMVIFSL